jgi:hypothetical protein
VIKPLGDRRQLVWRLLRGDAALLALGNPTVSTAYSLCVYDQTAQTSALAFAINVAPGGICLNGSCWKTLGAVSSPTGYRFKDAAGLQHGVGKLLLKGGNPGRDKLLLKGTGSTLPLSPAVGPGQYLSQQDDVTVQLVNSEGACWQSVFQPGHVAANRGDLYKAKR